MDSDSILFFGKYYVENIYFGGFVWPFGMAWYIYKKRGAMILEMCCAGISNEYVVLSFRFPAISSSYYRFAAAYTASDNGTNANIKQQIKQ